MRYAYLHQSSVASATRSIGERIGLAEVGAGASLLVINTKDHEAFVGHRVNEVLALDNDRVGRGDCSRKSAESSNVVGKLRCCQLFAFRLCMNYAQLTDFISSRCDRAWCEVERCLFLVMNGICL